MLSLGKSRDNACQCGGLATCLVSKLTKVRMTLQNAHINLVNIGEVLDLLVSSEYHLGNRG